MNTSVPIIIPGIICASLITTYYGVLKYKTKNKNDEASQDILNNCVIELSNGTCYSWWPVSHFIFYAIIGWFYPTQFIPAMLMGILWEGIEWTIGEYTQNSNEIKDIKDIKDIKSKNIYDTIRNKKQYIDQWWQGNTNDILFNAAGFLAGKFFLLNF